MPPAPDPQPHTNASSNKDAAWLNGIIWVVIGLAFWRAFAATGPYGGLGPLLVAFAAAAVSLVANLSIGMSKYAHGRRKEAKPYLLWLLPLVLPVWFIGYVFSHVSKIGG